MNEDTPRAFTSALKNIITRDLENAPPVEAKRILNWYNEGMTHYSEQLKKIPDALNRAYNLHEKVDSALTKIDAEYIAQISCKKGCAHCCHTLVIATQDEAELLLVHAKDIGIEIDWEVVSKQVWHAEIGESKYFLLDKVRRKCVFLGEDNLCKVYEHRPASCRKYLVVTPPDDCDGPLHTEVGVCFSRDAELITSGALDIDHSKQGSLQKMLLQARKEENL